MWEDETKKPREEEDERGRASAEGACYWQAHGMLQRKVGGKIVRARGKVHLHQDGVFFV